MQLNMPLKHKLIRTKQRGCWSRTEITPNTGNRRTKISAIFRGMFVTFFLRNFKIFVYFMVSGGTLVVENSPRYNAQSDAHHWSSGILTTNRFTEFRTYSKHYHQATPRMRVTKMNGVIYPVPQRGTASNSNTAILHRYQNKVLRETVNAPWYIPNKVLHADLKVPAIRKEITKFSVKYGDKISTHPNAITSTIIEE